MRTCIGCRRPQAATALVRCRLTADGRALCARAGAREAGRGAWICADSLACFDLAVKRGAFGRAWRRLVSNEALSELRLAFGTSDASMRELRVAGSAGVSAWTKG